MLDLILFVAFEADNNSVAGGDAVLECHATLQNDATEKLDVDEDDVELYVRVLDSAGAEIVAGVLMEAMEGTDLTDWWGSITIPAASGTGRYQVQFYINEDIAVPDDLQRSVGAKELDKSDFVRRSTPFRYLA